MDLELSPHGLGIFTACAKQEKGSLQDSCVCHTGYQIVNVIITVNAVTMKCNILLSAGNQEKKKIRVLNL
jgi:hypothetical protein